MSTSKPDPLRQKLSRRLDTFRLSLAHVDALPQLCLLGVISGIGTGCFIVLFRYAIDLPLSHFLPGGNSENFEALDPLYHFCLPIVGAVILAIIFQWLHKDSHRVGISHVIERLQSHQSRLPLKNMLAQFVAGALTMISGFSVGREGPAVHLGASSSSLFGQWLRLPNNSLRILVGCGSAAAIAASFNTPMAGVIFAMEVILFDYTIASFMPVILAAVSATIISQLNFGSDPAFSVPEAIAMQSLGELPYIALCGFIIGCIASLFLWLQLNFLKLNQRPVWQRFLLAGVITGTLAIATPQIMGIGYDTIEAALHGQLILAILLPLILTKLIASAAASGLGIPGGLIGPSLVTGACIGAALGLIGQEFFGSTTNMAFYVIIGLAAMMSAVIHAPLAALLAAMELTWSPQIILPSMLAIVISNLVCSQLFGMNSAFSATLSSRSSKQYLLSNILQRAGVTSIMKTNFLVHSRYIGLEKARELIEEQPGWIVISDVGEDRFLLNPAGLSHFIDTHSGQLMAEGEEIDLLNIPAERLDLISIHRGASLNEAQQLLQESGKSALFVQRSEAGPLMSDVAGIITEQDLRNYYAPTA